MIHQTIKTQITEAMRAKDSVKLDTLRGLNSAFQNELIATAGAGEFLPDDKVLAIIRRSVKQHKDSIDQFTKGGRTDLVDKEAAELKILESFLPAMMSREDIRAHVAKKIETLKASGPIDAKSIGKITGMMMKELTGKADGADVKAVVEEVVK